MRTIRICSACGAEMGPAIDTCWLCHAPLSESMQGKGSPERAGTQRDLSIVRCLVVLAAVAIVGGLALQNIGYALVFLVVVAPPLVVIILPKRWVAEPPPPMPSQLPYQEEPVSPRMQALHSATSGVGIALLMVLAAFVAFVIALLNVLPPSHAP